MCICYDKPIFALIANYMQPYNIRVKAIHKIMRYLKLNTLSPEDKAISLTIGFYLGIFPIFGLTTTLCLLTILLFRLNPVLILAMNWLVTPLQLVLIYPFLKSGRMLLFDDKHILPDVSVKAWLSAENMEAICHLTESAIGGIVMWSILSVSSGYFLYLFFLKVSIRNIRN
ncbi:MAG: DUF2062 domain-containing protein [Prolixibacteraceae bacterium]|nr:DUF2062 domain-containing protein [Prolixibacteraceae bacterium]